jgi:hypothetical protein
VEELPLLYLLGQLVYVVQYKYFKPYISFL